MPCGQLSALLKIPIRSYLYRAMNRYALFLLSIVFFSSCASVSVSTDYNPEAPLSEYRTYQYQSEEPTGLSELDEGRLYGVMDSVLQSKGWRKKPLPDVFIDVRSEIRAAQNSGVGVGIGGTGRQAGGGLSVGVPVNTNSQRRMISFLFVDFRSNEVVWEARALGPFNEYWKPQKREQELRKVVLKTLSRYPFVD